MSWSSKSKCSENLKYFNSCILILKLISNFMVVSDRYFYSKQHQCLKKETFNPLLA